jgi:UDP-N-acetylmuramyl pentapeptide synthase
MNPKLKLVEDEKVGQGLTEGSSLVFNHNYFPTAVAETGASAALVSDPPRAINSLRDLSLLQVQDTLTTLRKLAPSYRQLMPLRPLQNCSQ